MSDFITKPRDPEMTGFIAEVIGNTLLAFGMSFFAARMGFAMDLAPRFILMMILAVFFFVINLDPIGMLRARPSLRDLVAKTAVGLVLGVFVMLIYPRLDDGMGGEITVSSASSGGGLALLKTVGPLLLLMPLLFFIPFLERLVSGQIQARPVTLEQAKISAAFPVFVTLHMGLMLVVPGVMWLLGLSATWALAVAILGIVIAVIDTRTAPREVETCDLEEAGWGTQADTASEAWSKLRQGLPALASSALFVGATIYMSILSAQPFVLRFELLQATPTTAIGAVLVSGLLVLGIFLAVSVLAAVALAAASYSLARWHGADPLTARAFSRRARMRLFGGAMPFVRPEIEDEG